RTLFIQSPLESSVLVLFFEVIKLAGPTFFAQFNYLAVPAGAAWGAVIFDEHLSLYYFLAMLLMFIGMFLLAVNRSKSFCTVVPVSFGERPCRPQPIRRRLALYQ